MLQIPRNSLVATQNRKITLSNGKTYAATNYQINSVALSNGGDIAALAEVIYDQSTGEWHLARTDIRAVRGFCTSSKAIEEIPMSAYLITGGENPRLELKCDTVLEYEYGPFSRYQDLKQEYTFQLDEPGDVLAPGVPAEGTMDLRTYLSLALGFLMWPPVVLLIAYLLWRRFKKRLDAIQPMETPGSDREVKQE